MQISRTAAFRSIGAFAIVALIIILLVFALHQRASNTTGPASTTNCASALPGAGPASAGINFTDLPLPANSLSTVPTNIGGGGAGQFTLYEVQMCTSDSSPSAVTTFFTNLTAHSWFHSATFPSDGAYQSNCANSYCWAKDVRYVSLAAPITDLGGGIERYHLTLATAPLAPDCNGGGSIFPAGYYYQLPDPHYVTTNVFANIPLPPLSRIVPDDASGGQRGYEICSAGTVTSISAFMTTQLTALGWTSVGSGAWSKNGFNLTVLLNAPTGWLIGWHDPDFHA